ncbi:MAG: hypothetical protein U9Q91_05015 [Candidatus Marinimicrobia bacterium]|nr:hypothetical protein [Candidatus Neomarinimicrobiota bacterium]
MSYKTKFTLLGLPLVHIATSKIENGRYKRGIAKGWIAIGDISFGVILSVGGFAFGGVAVGGLAVGLLSLAGMAIGVLAFGGGAIGILATGGGAVAWHAATGGFAMANEYALGGEAIANQANNLIAEDYFKNSTFFSSTKVISEHSRWFILLVFLPVILNLIHKWKHRGSM